MTETHRVFVRATPEPWHRRRSSLPRTSTLALLSVIGTMAGCASPTTDEPLPEPTQTTQGEWQLGSDIDTTGPTTSSTPIGLALEFENGAGPNVRVRAGQKFFIEQLDLRGAIDATTDEGVAGLADRGSLANLDWRGVELDDQEFVGLGNPDGTFTRRRFYTGARWMRRPSVMVISQLDDRGRPTAAPWVLNLGADSHRSPLDTFFIRRTRAIQWTYDCPSKDDCSGASLFQEEGLVELRHSAWTHQVRRFASRTTRLELLWSELPAARWTVGVEQVPDPGYDYNFNILMDIEEPTSGVFQPGDDVPVTLTLVDGSGERLHPEGSLPSYADVVFGPNPAGIDYYNAFFDPTTTFYRRKHRERMMAIQMIGPAQDIQPIRTVAPLEQFLVPSDTLLLGTQDRDGMYAEAQLFPPAHVLFGGAFFPESGAWETPVSDQITFHVPADAKPGTYRITMKARRTFMGQDIPRSVTKEIQVGSAEHTQASLPTGSCNSCHDGAGDLSRVLHASADRAACNGCHVPLGFELEGPVYVRTHFIHSRSERFDRPKNDCSSCHKEKSSIQRVSKSACLSCHDSYPSSHVAAFGPIQSMYVGGDTESFDTCTSSCHQNHPGSRL